MSTFKNKNSLRTIEAEISKKLLKNNEARLNFTRSYKKKRVCQLRVIGKFKNDAWQFWHSN